MTEHLFYQLFEASSSTYTYLIADKKTSEAVLIDPVIEMVDRDLNLIKELGLSLKLILETHIHADHISGAAELRKKTSAKIGVSEAGGAKGVDIPLKDGQELQVGSIAIKVIATPGHTDSCVSFLIGDDVFTGDALMIRVAGRTDFQQGSPKKLYQSIHKLFALPDETKVYPAHDYKGLSHSTIGLEKKFNQRIGGGKSEREFEKIMTELKLSLPKRIHEAIPANLNLGAPAVAQLQPAKENGIAVIEPNEVFAHLSNGVQIIDVRRPDEFNGELGHVHGARLVTLGPDLMQFLETADRSKETVFICRSGARSGQATGLAQNFGFNLAMTMAGGMLRWNELGLPVKKD